MTKKIALVTGASSGIGEACSRLLAENDYQVIICGRRASRINQLKADLSKKTEVYTLLFDIRDKEAVKSAIEGLPAAWRQIDVLINNAGNAHGLGPIQSGDIDDWDAMIDSNVKGLLYISRAVIPLMVNRKKGHIVNIGSIAGKEVYGGGNVYCASKFAVDAINKGMLIDLNGLGIKVTAINPGLVSTEFSSVRFKGDEERAQKVYQGLDPLKAMDIAEVILFVLSRPAHVNISDMVVLATAQATATVVARENA